MMGTCNHTLAVYDKGKSSVHFWKFFSVTTAISFGLHIYFGRLVSLLHYSVSFHSDGESLFEMFSVTNTDGCWDSRLIMRAGCYHLYIDIGLFRSLCAIVAGARGIQPSISGLYQLFFDCTPSIFREIANCQLGKKFGEIYLWKWCYEPRMGRIVSDACNGKHFGEVTTSTKDVRKNSVEDISVWHPFFGFWPSAKFRTIPLPLFVRRVSIYPLFWQSCTQYGRVY